MKKLAVRPRGTIGIVDIGTTKVCCFIARHGGSETQIVGIGHQVARGVKNGVIVDIDAASQSILAAAHAAEQMAGETLTEVVVNLSGGFNASRLVKSDISLNGREITDSDMRRVLDHGHGLKEPADRVVIHSIPVGFAVDHSRGIRDPRGMYAQKLGVNMHLVTAQAGAVRNLATCIGRCHLDIAALVVSPYAAGLAALVEDETELGVTVIDMGGGTTGIAVFAEGQVLHTAQLPVGGTHVTGDIARLLSTTLAHAERLKTLYGNAESSPDDERELLPVPLIGEDEHQIAKVPRSMVVSIIRPRLEETFEMARDKLESSGLGRAAGTRLVLTGGACQLPGAREMAARILSRQVRRGRPHSLRGLPDVASGPAFATASGLLAWAAGDGRGMHDIDLDAERPSGLLRRILNFLRERV